MFLYDVIHHIYKSQMPVICTYMSSIECHTYLHTCIGICVYVVTLYKYKYTHTYTHSHWLSNLSLPNLAIDNKHLIYAMVGLCPEKIC